MVQLSPVFVYLYKAECHSEEVDFDQNRRDKNYDEESDRKFCPVSSNIPIRSTRRPDSFQNITIPTNLNRLRFVTYNLLLVFIFFNFSTIAKGKKHQIKLQSQQQAEAIMLC